MDKEKTTKTFVAIIAVLLIIIAGYFVFNKKTIQVPVQEQPAPIVSQQYVNNQYGFSISLPDTWKGYTVVVDNWTGTNIDDSKAPSIKGPKLLIRHPLWTAANPRQDIPVMVFTPAQWDLVVQEKLSLGAAPIGPSELGRNVNYIFALPARYNFAYATGFEEVQQIIDSKSFRAF